MKKYDGTASFISPREIEVGGERFTAKMFEEEGIAVYQVPFTKLDRALTSGGTEGFVKMTTKKWSSKILGAVIVPPRAGEMLQELTAAKLFGIPLRKLVRLIHPYPVYSTAIRKAADMWLTQTILPALRGKKT